MFPSVLIAGLIAASSVTARTLPVRDTAFGSCTNPAIIFADGLDGRNQPSFEPANESDFNHGSALGIAVITSFICQQLNDKCKASAAQISACNAGATAAAALTGQAAADAFNAALGVSATTGSTSTVASTTTVSTTTTTSASIAPTTTVSTAALTSSNLTFGKCTDPSVIFAAGLAGRKATEFSFEPHDLTQFNHGTALNPDIIFQFVCDNLVNNCGLTNADSVVITCRSAQKTADTFGHTGKAADVFNGLLGFVTDFAALDSQLSATVGGTSTSTSPSTTSAPALAVQTTCNGASTTTVMVTVTTTSATTSTPAVLVVSKTTDSSCPPASTVTVQKTKTVTVTSTPATTIGTSAPTSTPATSTGNSTLTTTSTTLNFGKCTDPSVIFAAGLDGRKATEFSFEPHDLTQFNHDTALNPDIIFQFVCDNLVNNCGLTNADSTVITCRSAQKTADTFGHTGKAADVFNGLLGFVTDFAALDTNATSTAGKRTYKKRVDPRVPLKEMTQFAKRHGYSPARYIK